MYLPILSGVRRDFINGRREWGYISNWFAGDSACTRTPVLILITFIPLRLENLSEKEFNSCYVKYSYHQEQRQ